MSDRRLPPGVVALAALCALAVGILWSLQAATGAHAYDEVSRVDPWGERGTFTYAPMLADGSGELPMGEPGYFTTDSPRMRVAFAWTLDDASAQRVAAMGELHLVARHASPTWVERMPIAQGTYDGAADGSLLLSGEIDLPAALARIEETPGRDATGATWAIVANVRFASAPVTAHKSDASAFELPLTYTPPLYTLPGADGASSAKDHAREAVVHHAAPSTLASLAARPTGPALVALGLVGMIPYLRERPVEEESA